MTIKLAASSLAFPDCNQAPYADRRGKKPKTTKIVYFQRNCDFMIFFYTQFIYMK